MARGAATFFGSKGAAVNIAAPSDNAAAAIASAVGIRHVRWNAVHDMRNDVIVFADRGLVCGLGKGQVNPMMMRDRMTVVDLTVGLRGSTFADEARGRGSRYIDPVDVYSIQLNLLFCQLTGRDLPEGVLAKELME